MPNFSAQRESLESHLQAAAPAIAAGQFNLLPILWNWLTSLAGGLVATPEERATLSTWIMDTFYDSAAKAALASNALLGAAFVAARPAVKSGVDFLLSQFAPAPPPAPPIPVPVAPIGSASP